MPSQTPPRNSSGKGYRALAPPIYLYRLRRKRWAGRKRWAEELLPDMDAAMWKQYCQWVKEWQPPKETTVHTQVRDAPKARR